MCAEGYAMRFNRAAKGFFSRRMLAAVLGAVLLASCGGGGGSGPVAAASTDIGPAGGTLSAASGARVEVPAGALATMTTLAIEPSAAGAPALPPGFLAAGEMFAFTPHGISFATPVTVSVPLDPAALGGRVPSLFKTDAAGGWERVSGASRSGLLVSGAVTGFSWFQVGASPPLISQQPQDATVAAGSAATFSVTALGAPPFTYRWERSPDAGMTWTVVDGATDRVLVTAAMQAQDDGARFRAIVRNPDGDAISQSARLTVTAAVPPLAGAASGALLSAGDHFTVARLADGSLRSWGSDLIGSLGDGGAVDAMQTAPVAVTGLGDVVAIDSKQASSFALRRNGEVWGWGNNVYGQLGDGSTAIARAPVRYVGTAALRGVRAVAMGGSHGLILRDDGRIEAVGSNRYGELGNPAVVSSTAVAVEVVLPPAMKPVVAIAAAPGLSLALDDDGAVWMWGVLSGGPLGNVVIAQSALPQRVDGIDPVERIATGGGHVLALARDGQLWSWGNNYLFGQLGRGSGLGDYTAVPGRIALAGPFVAIAAGSLHSVALHADGRVFAWGDNTSGELGNGTTTPPWSDTPVRVAALPAGVRTIAAGGFGSVHALAPDGRVWAWGFNAYGQLGDGSTVDRLAPVVLPGLDLD